MAFDARAINSKGPQLDVKNDYVKEILAQSKKPVISDGAKTDKITDSFGHAQDVSRATPPAPSFAADLGTVNAAGFKLAGPSVQVAAQLLQGLEIV